MCTVILVISLTMLSGKTSTYVKYTDLDGAMYQTFVAWDKDFQKQFGIKKAVVQRSVEKKAFDCLEGPR